MIIIIVASYTRSMSLGTSKGFSLNFKLAGISGFYNNDNKIFLKIFIIIKNCYNSKINKLMFKNFQRL